MPVTKVLHLKSAVTVLPDGAIIGRSEKVDDLSVFPDFARRSQAGERGVRQRGVVEPVAIERVCLFEPSGQVGWIGLHADSMSRPRARPNQERRKASTASTRR